MRKVLIFLINLYQKIPGRFHSACRYSPTCSEYMKEAIFVYGSFKGVYLGIRRICRCRPFGGCGYDPVPIKKNKN